MNSTVGVTPVRSSQLDSPLPGKTQDSPFLSAQSLQQLDAENVGQLVPDINNVAVHFEDPPDVDDLLAVTAQPEFTALISELTKSRSNQKPGAPPLEHTSSLDSLVGLLKALPETDDTQLPIDPPSLRSYSMPVDMGKGNLPRDRIWGEKPPINRAHSGFQFNAPSLEAAQVSMLVPGLGCSSSISRVPKPPVLVKVGEKMATAAQESFRAALTSKWVDEDGSDGEDTDGPDDGLAIQLLARTRLPVAPHVPAPLPNSKAGIMKRVMELQAKLLGPITRMGKKTPLLPQINALHPLFKAHKNCVAMKGRMLPSTFFSPFGSSGQAAEELPAMPAPSPASKGTALIKKRKTETEDDLLLDMGDLGGLIDENSTFGALFENGFDDQGPNSDTMLDLDTQAYNDILKSFDTNGL